MIIILLNFGMLENKVRKRYRLCIKRHFCDDFIKSDSLPADPAVAQNKTLIISGI